MAYEGTQPVVEDVLRVQLINEATTTRVESVILDADSFRTAGSRAVARFTLVQKGNVLAPNSKLCFKATWANFAAGTDAGVSFPRFSGCLGTIAEARLFCGGLIEQTQLAGQKAFLETLGIPYDAKNEVVDVLQGGNHGYSYDAAGLLQLAPDPQYAEEGYRGLTDSDTATMEVQVPLDRLFASLKDVMLPTFLIDPIVIEIEWDLDTTSVMTAAGAAVPAPVGNIAIARPRLMCEYLVLPEPMVDAMRERFYGPQGVPYQFRQSNLVRKQSAAMADSDTKTDDFEIGFSNQLVTKLLVQNNLTGSDNNLLRNCRSEGLYAFVLQCFINNQQIFNRDVSLMGELYSYLSQTYGTPAKIPPNAFELIGALAANNPCSDDVVQPSLAGVAETGVQEDLQGKLRPLGINLAQQRGGLDTAANALLIGDSPIVLRYQRTMPAAAGTTARGEAVSAAQKSALNVNVFVEAVRTMTIADGRIQVSSF